MFEEAGMRESLQNPITDKTPNKKPAMPRRHFPQEKLLADVD